MPSAPNGTTQYVMLEQRLILLAWLNGQFGYENNRDLMAEMAASGRLNNTPGSRTLWTEFLQKSKGERAAQPGNKRPTFCLAGVYQKTAL